ncbi:MAG: polyribonucleotide nucleotidyltransferase [Deltaproteobacteria bacterium]|nr:polyribonucleotide nucleotidyltransferase [Deltaproteobacteria bacterium]MDZ4345194.1 polyribonucleotide nucleotidyltransferase [Candidatus Binatia bacterium]
MVKKVELEFHGRPLSIEIGRMAKQADGAALVRYGETVVLVTAVAARDLKLDMDFFPLTVDYQERTFAAGKIPGGFFKREGRPSEKEILTCRLIDRSIRPLFSEGLRCETQIIATVLSADRENDPDVLAMLGTSAALHVSDIPFNGPLAGVRIGRIDGRWIVNPTQSQLQESDTDIFLSGSRDAIVMVEGGAQMVPEDEILEALFTGHEAIQPLLKIQEELRREVGKVKREVPLAEIDAGIVRRVEELALTKLKQALDVPEKLARYKRIAEIKGEVVTQAGAEFPDKGKHIKSAFDELKRNCFRGLVVHQEKRIDGRGLKDIRPITCEVEVLPRTHGSALFTRGETQALVVTTLGTASDEQRVDALLGEHYKKFMLHYNFPPFSVGEVKFLRGPGRREIGHGNLAERALLPVLPAEEGFPYTIRIVSEILESNGSSSMATICGGSLALMDAGVPVAAPVAGIAMGLIKEGEHVRVLSDILGDEDHLGDMDFKVAGTPSGITSLQMDIKVSGVNRDVMRQALHQAREGRMHILGIMEQTIASHRANVSGHAPRIITIKVKPDKIREIIGPGGKVIRGIIEATGVKMDVEDDGTVIIASSDEAAAQKAVEMVQRIAAEAEIGKIYKGTVRKIVEFGAFVEILPGTDGLVHISQLAPERVHRVSDVLKEGDEVMVKVLEIDRQGKIRLSRKEALLETGGDSENLS